MNAPSAFMLTVFEALFLVIDLYMWAVFLAGAISMLIAFNVINPHNRFVQVIGDFLVRITEPALRPIRKAVPPVNGLDLSPLILLFILWFLRMFLAHLVF